MYIVICWHFMDFSCFIKFARIRTCWIDFWINIWWLSWFQFSNNALYFSIKFAGRIFQIKWTDAEALFGISIYWFTSNKLFKQHIFNSASVLLNFLTNWTLLTKYEHYLTVTMSCLRIGLFMSSLCDLFFITIFIFIIINHITS